LFVLDFSSLLNSPLKFKHQLVLLISLSITLVAQFDFAAPARLPGFHVCVGSGGERLLPEWYTEKGDFGFYPHCFSSVLLLDGVRNQ